MKVKKMKEMSNPPVPGLELQLKRQEEVIENLLNDVTAENRARNYQRKQIQGIVEHLVCEREELLVRLKRIDMSLRSLGVSNLESVPIWKGFKKG